jgi:hypothetical protein
MICKEYKEIMTQTFDKIRLLCEEIDIVRGDLPFKCTHIRIE